MKPEDGAPIRALVILAVVIAVGEGLKFALKHVTFTSFGGGDVNLAMGIALGAVLFLFGGWVADRVQK